MISMTQSRILNLIPDGVNQETDSMAKYTFEQMIGSSRLFGKVINQARLAAATNFNVLITGETGTGKELMAQAIHNASYRSQMPFATINCVALPRGLVNSELFGYEKDSFTGSNRRGSPGKFELADGGTLFLDEIGEMPLDVQVALLRVIQEKEVTRIGGSKAKKVDVRIIAATNRDLFKGVQKKTIRQDLFNQLNILAINMPPLRDRREDLDPLINSTLKRLKRQTGKSSLVIDAYAMELLRSYDWPGNIRELENMLERAAIICEDGVIRCHDIPFDHEGKSAKKKNVSILRQTEMGLIMDTLIATKGNIKQTADRLGTNRNTIYRKLKKYNVPIGFGKNTNI